jgi:hypothetical protein
VKLARALLSICTLIALAACTGNEGGGAENALPNASQPMASQPMAPQDSNPQAPAPEMTPQAAPPEAIPQPSAPEEMPPEPPLATTAPARKMRVAAASTPMPMITLHPGEIIPSVAEDNLFTPNDGDASNGGHGGLIDGLACNATMTEDMYHVHAFLGLLVNGKQIVIPDAIGLNQPGAESKGLTNTAKCYYNMHTHDATGMIHIEANSSASLGSAIYNLGYFLDIWGEKLTASGFGSQFPGTTKVFYATTPLRNLYSGTYQQYTGTSPRTIKLYSHEAIWIEVGPTFVPASQLPKVQFYTEY